MEGPPLLSIGEVARRAGLRPSALRFYEESGLLRPTARVAGRRRFDPSVLSRLQVIRLLRDLGFGIEEIRQLLAVGRDRRGWHRLAEAKLSELEARIADAQETRRLIEQAIACQCESLEGCEAVAAGFGGHSRRTIAGRRRPPWTR